MLKVIPSEGPKRAKIYLLGEAPGTDETAQGRPFVGFAGRTLTQLLTQAGINRMECMIGNVARIQPPGNNMDHYFLDKKHTIPTPELIQFLKIMEEEIREVKPNVVVALGAIPLWAMTGLRGIKTYRGTVMESTLIPGQKVLPTYHPQAVNWEWGLAFPTIMDLRKARRHSYSKKIPEDKRFLNTTPSLEEWIGFCQGALNLQQSVAVDIETSQPGCHISRIGFANDASNAISFEILRGHTNMLNHNNEVEFWKWTSKVLYECPLIFHNAVYDASVLSRNHGAYCRDIEFDTLVAAHCCWPETPRDLGFLASVCLDVPAWKQKAKEDQGIYNALDTCNTYGIATFFRGEIARMGVQDIFDKEMKEIEVACMLQLQGIRIDVPRLTTIKSEIEEKYNTAKSELDTITGGGINYNAPKQVQNYLYITLGLPPQYKRRKSKEEVQKITADEEALDKLARRYKHPAVEKLLNYREFSKLLTSFANMSVSPEGKVHTSYNITGSSSDSEMDFSKSFGRWSSSQSIIDTYGPGNLQNVPSRGYGSIIRNVFVPDPGYVILRGDYVQAEAVVVIYLINDQRLKMAIINHEDMHILSASLMFGVPYEEVTKDQRTIGKLIRHASNYSAGPAVLAKALRCELAEAKQLLELYHRMCPMLRIWHESIKEELTRNNRTLVNLLGRKHRFLERWGDGLFRSAFSYKPQSTVGDLLNFSLCDFYYKYGSEMDILLQLHDAFYIQVPDNSEGVQTGMARMRECMIKPIIINNEEMVIDVDFAVGPSWGELKEVKG